jgi:hypothetical protein
MASRSAPNKPHWAHVVSYGLFSLSVIHKEGQCPCSGNINRLMMMRWDIFSFVNTHVLNTNTPRPNTNRHILHTKYVCIVRGRTRELLMNDVDWIKRKIEELGGRAVSALGVRSRKLSTGLNGQSWDGRPKIYYLELLRASKGTLSHWSRLYLQLIALTNLHWARLVGYGSFSLWVIHKEGLCPSSGDINRLMMMMMMNKAYNIVRFDSNT